LRSSSEKRGEKALGIIASFLGNTIAKSVAELLSASLRSALLNVTCEVLHRYVTDRKVIKLATVLRNVAFAYFTIEPKPDELIGANVSVLSFVIKQCTPAVFVWIAVVKRKRYEQMVTQGIISPIPSITEGGE
jgi:hypothetical protein